MSEVCKLERCNVRNLAQLPLALRLVLTNAHFIIDLAAENPEEGLEAFEDVLTIEEEPGNWYVLKIGLLPPTTADSVLQ